MRIFLDPGHGGRDLGAVNPRTGVKEKDLVLLYALVIRDELLRRGHDVRLSRDGDYFVALSERVRGANTWDAHAFVSLHANAAENPAAHGFEIWTSVGQTEADPLATAIFERVEIAFPEMNMRACYEDGDPDKEANFYVLRRTVPPAVLIELGFVSHDAESIWLGGPQTVERLALAVVSGIDVWHIRRRHVPEGVLLAERSRDVGPAGSGR